MYLQQSLNTLNTANFIAWKVIILIILKTINAYRLIGVGGTILETPHHWTEKESVIKSK